MSGTKRAAIPIVLIGIGAVMIVLGIFSGEVSVILRRAIYICLECIGIG
jgi:hypothetical protein